MYKLILVDDESEVRSGIIKKIDWESIGFEVIGEAENGVEALEIIENNNPDLAIIDIEMPYMNGVELSKIIHKEYPALKVIILSGYDEFEYAQKAIRYNVIEYVLKPISASDLIELLSRTRDKLDDERNERNNLIRLKSDYMESLSIIKARFLNALILERHSIIDIEEKMQRYGMNLPAGELIVAVVKPDDYNQLNEKVVNTSEERELYAYSVFNTCKEICKESTYTVFQTHEGNTVIVIDNKKLNSQLNVLEEIRAVVEKSHINTVTIGLGEVVKDISLIKNSYQGAIMALNYQLLEGSNKILWINDLEPKRLERIVFDEIAESNLNNAIRSEDSAVLSNFLNEIFSNLQGLNISFENFKSYVNEMIIGLIKVARSYDIELKWLNEHKNIYKIVSEINNLSELEEIVYQLANELNTSILSSRKSSIKLIIEQAVEYINEYYNHEDISLDYVSQLLHISSAYLSRLFKKEKNITFINYLTEVRMNHAKKLIEDTNLKNFEVSEKVGYSEANYFSYSYKKFFGVSPSKYRKSLNK